MQCKRTELLSLSFHMNVNTVQRIKVKNKNKIKKIYRGGKTKKAGHHDPIEYISTRTWNWNILLKQITGEGFETPKKIFIILYCSWHDCTKNKYGETHI